MARRPRQAPPAGPRKIALADLVARADAGTLTDDEIRRAFVLDPVETTAFSPHFQINPETVEVGALRSTAVAAGHAIALDATEKARLARAAAGPAPNGSYVAEGDSWFRLPSIVYPRTMVDVLAETYPVNNLAHWGDTLAEMIASGEYARYMRSGALRVLLFSGGGNDILGDDLERCLNLYDNQHSDPADAAYYLTDFFYDRLSELEQLYTGLILQVATVAPQARIFVHGYDYAQPKENGIYLGVHFQRRGLHPRDHGALCNAIVKLMIDLFNDRLSFLAAHHPAFNHVDLRGTIRANEWFDAELHPKESASKRLAAKLAAALGPPVRG